MKIKKYFALDPHPSPLPKGEGEKLLILRHSLQPFLRELYCIFAADATFRIALLLLPRHATITPKRAVNPSNIVTVGERFMNYASGTDCPACT